MNRGVAARHLPGTEVRGGRATYFRSATYTSAAKPVVHHIRRFSRALTRITHVYWRLLQDVREADVAEKDAKADILETVDVCADLLAQVVLSKYWDHTPLYRQEDISSRHRITLRRSTLCDWIAAASDLAEPPYQRMSQLVRGAGQV